MVTETAATAAPKSARRRQPTHPQQTAPEIGQAVAPVRSRRPWVFGAGAVAAIIAGGLIGVFVYTSSQSTDQVFVTATDIDRGATLTAQDLTTISVTPNQQLNAFTRAQAEDLIGQTAAVELPKGSLITEQSVSPSLVVPEGQAMVGIALKPSQLPSAPLRAGDRIVITSIAQQGGAEPTSADDVEAIIANATEKDQTSGLIIVNALVPQSAASDVASRAAAGMVTIYLKPVK
jgi:hypothetical protein